MTPGCPAPGALRCAQGTCVPTDEEIDWEKVRLQVKAGEMTRNRICAEHGITPQRLARRIKEMKWDVDEDATDHDRKILVTWLYRAFEQQIIHLVETGMSKSGEHESMLLGRLALNLDRMIALDIRVTGKKPTARQSKEAIELRDRLRKRMHELKVR
jgi:hypothetical protein